MPFYTAIPADLFYCCQLAVLLLLLLPLLFRLFRSIIPIVLLLPFSLTATNRLLLPRFLLLKVLLLDVLLLNTQTEFFYQLFYY